MTAIQQKDMEGIMQNHTNDILMFDVPIPLQSKGLNEYKKHGTYFFNTVGVEKTRFNLMNSKYMRAIMLRSALH